MKTLRALALSFLVCSAAVAQTAALMPVPKFQALDANGYPLSGGLVYTCSAGSTCPGTPLASYTTASAGTANTNPVVLDAGGFASIWLGSNAYKIVVETAAGVVISSTDNISGNNALTNTRLTTPTITTPAITGGTIAGSAVSGGTVSGAAITGGSVTSPSVSAGTYSYAPISTQYLITEGDSTSANIGVPNPATQAWGAQLSQLPFFKNRSTFINAAISGSTCATMTARYATAVYPYRPNGTTITKSYLIVTIGRNDLALGASAMESCVASYITQAQTDGFTVTQGTILPSSVELAGPVGSPTCTVTAIAQTGTVFTVTCANTFTVGQTVFMQSLDYGVPYVNLTYVVTSASSTQWTATIPTGTLGTTAATGTVLTALGWSGPWTAIQPAQKPVLEAANDFYRRSSSANNGVIDFAQLLRDPNNILDTFDGTHPTLTMCTMMAQAAESYFEQGNHPVLPSLPINSLTGPTFSGMLTAGATTVTGAPRASSTVPNFANYINAGQVWQDAFDPTASAFLPVVMWTKTWTLTTGNNPVAITVDASQNATFSANIQSNGFNIIGNTGQFRTYFGPSPNTWAAVYIGYTGTNGFIHATDASGGSLVGKPLALNVGIGPVQAQGGSANAVVCWKADAKTLGFCSSVVGSGGTCTCN